MFFLPNARIAHVKVCGEKSKRGVNDVLHTRDKVTKYLFGLHPAEQITGLSVPTLQAPHHRGDEWRGSRGVKSPEPACSQGGRQRWQNMGGKKAPMMKYPAVPWPRGQGDHLEEKLPSWSPSCLQPRAEGTGVTAHTPVGGLEAAWRKPTLFLLV